MTGRGRLSLALLALLALAGLGAGTPSQDVVLVASFDEGLHASRGAPNPFSAAGAVTRERSGPGQGGFLRFGGHDPLPGGRPRPPSARSSLVFDGVNLPVAAGTLSFRVRLSGARRWDDGREAWLAVLAPLVGEPGIHRSGEQGTGLALLKTAAGELALGVWDFRDDRLTPYFQPRSRPSEVAPPDAVPIRLPVRAGAADWVPVRLGWDRASGRVWLGAGDRLESARLHLRGAGYRALLLGTPPLVHTARAPAGFDGDLDDLLLVARSPGDDPRAGRSFPSEPPPMARPPRHGASGGDRLERALRAEVATVLAAQRGAGWPHAVAFPSMLGFLSQKVVVPFSDRFLGLTMDGASSHVAIRLLAAYEVLRDPACLAAARRTADAMLALQHEQGAWPALAIQTPQGPIVYDRERAYFKDRVQTFGALLMWRMYELTGDDRYRFAARRAVEMVHRAQNPNGSWPYYLDLEDGRGKTIRGGLHGGEINDFATSDAMTLMLVWYRLTGDPKYLRSYLRGADWLVAAFIDGPAKGWAQQYDSRNRPIAGRSHEPAAVTTLGIVDPVTTLVEAHWLTGDARYLAPLRRWKAWAVAQRGPRGWYRYYDRAVDGKVQPADPRDATARDVERALQQLDPIPAAPPRVAPGRSEARRSRDRYGRQIERFLDAFDWHAGTWTAAWGTAGDAFFPADGKLMGLLWASLIDRQLRGELPWEHPLARLSRYEWQDSFAQLMPWAQLFARLTRDEAAVADELQMARSAAATGPLPGRPAVIPPGGVETDRSPET
jgi:hypothetical protein